ncbi:hypothetical protein SY83_13905 [Paenibacillus swuensis]|uniref:Uncharacterized protein n=1 Tax=Paenibacillus swuensis TaxID=1178515 RepID=A0A172TJE5_9BACL|nr:hypothetical protein [Paenibacillus swuensis]ANE47179.1 hypothetical protein SY83_13905 [Paenibacillus swuensis]
MMNAGWIRYVSIGLIIAGLLLFMADLDKLWIDAIAATAIISAYGLRLSMEARTKTIQNGSAIASCSTKRLITTGMTG